MLNLIKDKFITKNIYEDISTVYDIMGTNDNCILLKWFNNEWNTVSISYIKYNCSILQ